MPDFETIHAPEGFSIWSALLDSGDPEDENKPRRQGLYVLSDTALAYAVYDTAAPLRDILADIREGIDPAGALGKKATSIALKKISRVQKTPKDKELEIYYETKDSGKKAAIPCPDDLGNALFMALRDRLKKRLRFLKEPSSILKASIKPLTALLVCWMLGCCLFLGAGAYAWQQAHPAPLAPGQVKVVDRRAEGMKMLGGWLGYAGVGILTTVITVGIGSWMVVAILQRPARKVLERRSE